jgi:hypothetical protein
MRCGAAATSCKFFFPCHSLYSLNHTWIPTVTPRHHPTFVKVVKQCVCMYGGARVCVLVGGSLFQDHQRCQRDARRQPSHHGMRMPACEIFSGAHMYILHLVIATSGLGMQEIGAARTALTHPGLCCRTSCGTRSTSRASRATSS